MDHGKTLYFRYSSNGVISTWSIALGTTRCGDRRCGCSLVMTGAPQLSCTEPTSCISCICTSSEQPQGPLRTTHVTRSEQTRRRDLACDVSKNAFPFKNARPGTQPLPSCTFPASSIIIDPTNARGGDEGTGEGKGSMEAWTQAVMSKHIHR